MRHQRRDVTAVAVALALVFLTATGIAADRLQPGPGTYAVEQIAPDYTFLPVAAAPKPKPKPKAKPKPPVQSAAARIACPALPAVPAAPATAARAVVPRISVFDAPGGRPVRTLTNPTDEGQPLHALVRGRSGIWLRIQLVARPNGATGWVRMTDFAQYSVPYRIVVQRCAKRLTVFKGGKEVWARTVAVGKPRTPTPPGDFFVDFVTAMPCCTYGPYMLSIAGFSDVLYQFGKGGTGQIAIHGTSASWSVGKAASNGCVRMYNADVTELAHMVPAGTPVRIVD